MFCEYRIYPSLHRTKHVFPALKVLWGFFFANDLFSTEILCKMMDILTCNPFGLFSLENNLGTSFVSAVMSNNTVWHSCQKPLSRFQLPGLIMSPSTVLAIKALFLVHCGIREDLLIPVHVQYMTATKRQADLFDSELRSSSFTQVACGSLVSCSHILHCVCTACLL